MKMPLGVSPGACTLYFRLALDFNPLELFLKVESQRSSLIAKVKNICLFPPSIHFMPRILIALAPQSPWKPKLPCNDPILSWDPKLEPIQGRKVSLPTRGFLSVRGSPYRVPQRIGGTHGVAALEGQHPQHREWSAPEHTVHEQDHSLEPRATSRAIRCGEAGERQTLPSRAMRGGDGKARTVRPTAPESLGKEATDAGLSVGSLL